MKTKTAGILVICKENSKLFLVKRAPHHFYHANEWSIQSGHLDDGEKYKEAAIRELKEETQIENVEDISFLGALENEERRFEIFKGYVPNEINPVLDHEHTDYGWYSIYNIPSPMGQSLKKVIQRAL